MKLRISDEVAEMLRERTSHRKGGFVHDLLADRTTLLAEVERLQVIVNKMPKTADGQPAYNEMLVWCVMEDGSIYGTVAGWYCNPGALWSHGMYARGGFRLPNGTWMDRTYDIRKCYSTPEAAEAAGGDNGN